MATTKRLRMSITGTGITTPYATTMYYDLNMVNYDSADRKWAENDRDMMDNRAERPFHDLIDGTKIFSTKIVKYPDGHVIDDTTPYHFRRCTIVNAPNCWVEIGFFHEWETSAHLKEGTRIKLRRRQMTTSGTWSTSSWSFIANSFIDWTKDQSELIQQVTRYLGHLSYEGTSYNLYVDLALLTHRYPRYYHVGWGHITQSNPYDNPAWKDASGTPYPCRTYSYGGGYGDIESNLGNITNIEAVITYIMSGGNLPEFPYTDDGEGGGDGNPDNSSDDIGIPDMPVAPWNAIVSSGMVTLYNMSSAGMLQLTSKLFTENALQTAIKKVYQVPIDAILDCFYLPISSGDYTNKIITLGGYNTGITGRVPNNQYRDFDFGTVRLDPYYDSFLDYEPYCNLYIALPFIGIKKLDASLYTNASTHLVYRIDLLSGCFVAYLEVTKTDEYGTRTMLVNTFSGNCAIHLPLTNASATGITNGILSVGAGAISAGVSLATGNPLGLVPAVGQVAKGVGQAYIGSQSLESVTSYSGNLGFMGCLTPYFIIERPIPQIPYNYGQFNGFTSETETTLSLLSGYTQVHHINLPNIGMSDEEQQELLNILQSGIVI